MLGKIASMELNHKPVDKAARGDAIALKIESNSTEESSRLYGRHFDFRVSHTTFCPLLLAYPVITSFFNGICQ